MDLALIYGFTSSKWKPRTLWKGCRILDENDSSSIVMIDYLLRGAVLCNLCYEMYGNFLHNAARYPLKLPVLHVLGVNVIRLYSA